MERAVRTDIPLGTTKRSADMDAIALPKADQRPAASPPPAPAAITNRLRLLACRRCDGFAWLGDGDRSNSPVPWGVLLP